MVCIAGSLCVANPHQLCFPEGGSSHSVGDVTPATSAEIGVVPVHAAAGSNLHHAVLSGTSLMCTCYSNSDPKSCSPHTCFKPLSLKSDYPEKRMH